MYQRWQLTCFRPVFHFYTPCKRQKTRGFRGGSRTAATSKMEYFVIIVNGFQSLTYTTKCSILDVTAFLDPPLGCPRCPGGIELEYCFEMGHRFFSLWEKFVIRKWAPKTQKLKKMLRKLPASYAWATFFENADFS